MATVAIVGGGINGLCCAWQAARAGHDVTLFERGELMRETSAHSSKLLHGGLRYLETGDLRLVREALRERHWWLTQCPQLTRQLTITLPVYRGGPRPRWLLGLGLWLYDAFAGATRLARHRWLDADTLAARDPALCRDGLLGGYTYSDGQMDDYHLGLWVAEQAHRAGAVLHEHAAVSHVSADGSVVVAGERHVFDCVVNAAGPWAESLLTRSGIEPGHRIDPVRGSHIVFVGEPPAAYLLQTGRDRRVFFVLPWQGNTLVGTTEVRQSVDAPIEPHMDEIDYLLDEYNRYFNPPRNRDDIVDRFAGLRPLVHAGDDPRKTSRESALERHGRLLTVYGGKWTTAHALGARVVHRIQETAE